LGIAGQCVEHHVHVVDYILETLDPYRDCPEAEMRGCTGRGVGAVSIGTFEGSRWRLRWTRSAMGFESTLGWKLLY
jgi:hypothetical protein